MTRFGTLVRQRKSTMIRCRFCSLVSIAFLSLGSLFSLFGQVAPVAQQPVPTAQIDLSAVGFRGLSVSARLAAQSNMSLDFVDDDHVLLTFNPKKIFTRLPSCPPTHDDRMIHAVILTVPDGRVSKEADWYLHDHERYFWTLGGGRFLLRRLNSLYEVDSELHEKLILTSPRPLIWLGVTADGKQIITESKVDESDKAKARGKDAKAKVQLEFLDLETHAVQRTIKSEGKVQLDALSTGFADVIHNRSGKVWMVRFGPTGSSRENITRVRSRCIPDVMFSSGNTILVGRCAMSSPDYSVSAFTVTGHFLWRQHWNEHRYTPRLKRSDDGSRVAISSVARVILETPSDSETAAQQTDEGLKQHVQVLDTASGTGVISLEVAPAVLTAQNVSLSPAGRRLALVQGATLTVYDLPTMSQEDRARYLAVKDDLPGLYTPASEKEPEETLFTSLDSSEAAANDEDSAGKAQPSPASTTDSSKTATSQESASTQTPKAETAPATNEASSSVTNSSAPNPDASASTPKPVITFKATSRIVVEDVVVTDSKGHPVKGLKQEDFELSENNAPQHLRVFEEYPQPGSEETQRSAASAGSQTTTGSAQSTQVTPNIFSNSRLTGPETGSSTIIVLDLLNTAIADQTRAKSYLIDFIKKRPAASQMAICSLGYNLRLIQGFTRDETTLLAAINGKKGGVKAPPWQSDAGLEKSVQLARDVASVAGTAESILALQRTQNSLDEQMANDTDVRMRFTLDAFMQLGRYLAGVPGRKNLIWLSGSFPMSIQPNPDVNGYEPVTRNYYYDIKKTTNLLAEAHVAVYPVSASGLVAHSDAGNGNYFPAGLPGAQGPGHAGPSTALLNTPENLPMSSSTSIDDRNFRETQAGQMATMDEVAKLTGGKAFYDTNAIGDAIDSAVDLGSHYYTLSYTPTDHKYDGQFRKIKVTIKHPGYHLTYRGGYYAQDPDAGLKDTRKPQQRIGVAAMQQGAPQSRQVVFSTRVVPIGKPRKVDAAQVGMAKNPKKKGAPVGPVEVQHYAIDYAVDASDLRFGQTTEGVYHSVVDFMVTGFNDDGRLVASMVSTATNDLRPANYKDVMTGGYRLHQELDVPTEAVTLRMGVEDVASSRVGTLEIGLPVPVPPEVKEAMAKPLPPIEPD